MLKKIAAIALVMHCIGTAALAQERTNVSVLKAAAAIQKEKDVHNYQDALAQAKQKGWQLSFTTREGNLAYLVGTDANGKPVYFATESNIVAAATTGASQLWTGGSSGLNLNGSSNSVKAKLAVWDGGRVFATHQELVGRITQRDVPTSTSDHATHVSGTMIASGVNPTAKGMAWGMQELYAYDFNNHTSEMLGEASNLLLSNHSYGTISGWSYNSTQSRWEFYGVAGSTEDQNFGYYNSEAQLFDSIAYNAPYYLIVKSSGNNRGETGPSIGENYYRFDASGAMVNAGPRPAGISSNDGYDIISTYGVAKNILTVGAVNGIPNGYNTTSDVVMSTFSSWGPTDDGRIKPDIVADGVNLLSSVATNATAYSTYSGTSMASPNTTGSLLLLQEYYSQLHPGAFMRASTLKGLAIHCANEAGTTPGPDYKYGWGLLNVAKAAQVIKSNNVLSHQIFENTLNNNATFTMNVVASGPLTATIVWTDPKGSVATSNILNNTSPKLVNDLDIRVVQGSTTYFPWKMDPANPGNAATQGDNILDNVERINIDNAVPGLTYTIQITHKGTLQRGAQAYSLILSGVNGQVFCTSAPSSSAGARIDSVGFGSIQKLNTGTCTTYTDFTSVSTNVEPNQSLPITVRVNSCDATSVDKVVKVFIDFNNNGSFTDAGENVATSGVINGNGTFTGTVNIASNVVIGNPSVMRVIVQETNNPAAVLPCGTYAKGETQDYRLIFSQPSNDFKVEALVDPSASACSGNAQYVTVKLTNAGTAAQTNIPLTLEVKSGATTVSTVSGTYRFSIPAGESRNYTFPTPFASATATTYSIKAYVNNAADQNHLNDTLTTSVTTAAAASAPAGAGRVCGNSTILIASDATTPNYFWYADPNGSPIGVGLGLTTTVVAPNNTYYIGTGARAAVGLASKSSFPNGGDYLSNTNSFMKYSSSTPLTLETVKLYSKYGGKVDIIVGDITSESGTTFLYSAMTTKTIDIYPSSPTVAAGNQSGYDAADTGAVYFVNIALPSGNHAIIIKTQGSTNLFRSNNITGNPYPYGIPNFFTLTANSAATEGGTSQNYYYFLYDMKIRTTDCMSAKGTVVASVAPTPSISQNGNTLTSSSATGNQWMLNGTPITGANGQTYSPVTSGNYTVRVTDGFGCQLASTAVNVTFTAVTPVDPSSLELSVSPNPSHGVFNLRYKADRKDNLQVDVINAQGQKVYTKGFGVFTGELSTQINLQKAASGVYVIRVQQGSRTVTKKIIVE